MESDKATRLGIALIELLSITDGMSTEFDKRRDGSWHTISPYWERLSKLVSRPEYQELKNWVEGKRK